MAKGNKAKRKYTRSIQLVHEYDVIGRHRLTMGAKIGLWAGYSHIAMLGKFAAATEYYSGLLPRVFKFKPAETNTLMRGDVAPLPSVPEKRPEAA